MRFFLLFCTLANVALSEKRSLSGLETTVKGHNKVVVCYWGTWANYRPADGKFTPEDVDASLCTHLIYSFAGLDSENDVIKPLDPWMDLEEGYGLQGYRQATDLKYAYPHLKVSYFRSLINSPYLPWRNRTKIPLFRPSAHTGPVQS